MRSHQPPRPRASRATGPALSTGEVITACGFSSAQDEEDGYTEESEEEDEADRNADFLAQLFAAATASAAAGSGIVAVVGGERGTIALCRIK